MVALNAERAKSTRQQKLAMAGMVRSAALTERLILEARQAGMNDNELMLYLTETLSGMLDTILDECQIRSVAVTRAAIEQMQEHLAVRLIEVQQ